MARLTELGSVPAPMAQVLSAVVAARRNVLISGGTGSGKTTLLNAMSAAIDEHERIVTIEDSADLQLQPRSEERRLGKSVSVLLDLSGCLINKKKKKQNTKKK